MKQITFASFKGGAGKTTAMMAICSTLIKQNKRVALLEADENEPLSDWREAALRQGTWSDQIQIFDADDLEAFEKAFGEAMSNNFDYALIDTRGGGSELNDACMVNTNAIVIPSSLTTLDMTAALSTFEHAVGLLQSMNLDIPIRLLLQRLPAGKLTKAQQGDLESLQTLPCFKSKLHQRDSFGAIGKRGLLHLTHKQLMTNPMKQINANHVVTAISEATKLTEEVLAVLGEV